MVAALRQRVTVQPGGVIEIRSPELTPGAAAEVIVLVEGLAPVQGAASEGNDGPRTWASFIGSCKGQFRSVEEIDAYIRELRDEWDR